MYYHSIMDFPLNETFSDNINFLFLDELLPNDHFLGETAIDYRAFIKDAEKALNKSAVKSASNATSKQSRGKRLSKRIRKAITI